MKKTGFVLSRIFGTWLAFGGGFLIVAMLPQLLFARRIYLSAGAAASGLVIGLLLLAAGLLLLILPARKRKKAGIPLSKAWFIVPAVFLGIAALTLVLTCSMVHKNPAAPNLTAQQVRDVTPLAEKAGLLKQDWQPDWKKKEAAPAEITDALGGKAWLAVRVPGYESHDPSDVGAPVAWSGARLWLLTSWQEARPRQADMEDVEVLILCRYGLNTVDYGQSKYTPANARYNGSAEYVDIEYLDAATGELLYYERIGGKLPEKATKVPHEKISEEDLARHLRAVLGGK
jgi:hypothetical protein